MDGWFALPDLLSTNMSNGQLGRRVVQLLLRFLLWSWWTMRFQPKVNPKFHESTKLMSGISSAPGEPEPGN